MGADDTENPQYQVGEGCLVDQLLGQYLADVAGLGPLLDPSHIQKTAASIHHYNYRRSMADHDNVQRTFVLNDESALVICDYGKAKRPRIPFPYFAEAFTGSEYSAAVLMLYHGMAKEGVECIGSIRARYDGEKRNPWDEAECGHHYARAMAAWSGVAALSGFRYDGRVASIEALPRVNATNFHCFWSAGTGWGTFSVSAAGLRVRLLKGKLTCRSTDFRANGGKSSATLNGKAVAHKVSVRNGVARVEFDEALNISEGEELRVDVHA
jgi:non-lysosomal glucosylceramidase